MSIFWIAQAIGVVALGFSIYSYQAKTREKLLTRQMHGSFVYIIHYALLSVVALPFVWEGYISLLPTLAMLIGVYVRWEGNAATIRLGTFVGVVMWIPYTLFVESYAGTASNLVILGALIYSMVKHDKKPAKTEGIHGV